MTDHAFTDDHARRIGSIFPGRALGLQIENIRYRISRGIPDGEKLALFERAMELREDA